MTNEIITLKTKNNGTIKAYKFFFETKSYVFSLDVNGNATGQIYQTSDLQVA